MNRNIWRKWYLWVLLIAIAIVVAGRIEATTRPADTDAREAGLLQSSDEEETPLLASGTIQAEEIRIASELGGRIIEIAAVEGDGVNAGDVLVRLDASQLFSKLAEAEAAVFAAEADLALARQGARPEEITAARSALMLAEAQRDGARVAWENALATIEKPQELDARIVQARTQLSLAGQGVELAEAELARAQLEHDQRPDGSLERQIADYQVRAAEEALSTAQADQVAAQTLLNWLWTIRNEPLALIAQANVAEGQYLLAEAGVDIAQARLDDLLDGPMQQELAVAEAETLLAEKQADALQAQQDKFVIISAADGIVLELVALAGEVVAPAATILTIADLSEVRLVVYVPAKHIGRVELGQEVRASVDSFPGKLFAGRVVHIGDEPEFTPRNVATVEERLNTFFEVEIVLPNPDGDLKPGMPADAVFEER